MNEPKAYCGTFTFEKPYQVCKEGIEYRGQVVMTLGWRHSYKTAAGIASLLNEAYRIGYQEGQSAIAKFMLKNQDENN